MELRKLSKEKSTSKIIKRRSKSEIEGRTFSCEQCQKKYLSYPALYTHKKLKHEKNNEQNRKKGRPKKNQNENIIEKNKYNPVNITFFAKEERTGKTSYNEINSCIDDVFIELYVEDENGTEINDVVFLKWVGKEKITNGTLLKDIKKSFFVLYKENKYNTAQKPYQVSMFFDKSKYKKVKIKVFR